VRQVDFLDSEIAQVERLIAADALGWPEVKRLMTVPGVNVIVAATFMAAVGDIRRFPDRRKLTAYLGLDRNAPALIEWDVYEAVLTPGDLILMTVWKTKADAEAFGKSVKLPEGGRLRHVRVVRDYGMFDRREAPQYYPAVERPRGGA